jgi:hypothetical protein
VQNTYHDTIRNLSKSTCQPVKTIDKVMEDRMSHPFGDLIAQFLSRKHGLSQNKLAEGSGQDPAVIAHMCKGKRLTGRLARERVIAMIGWLSAQQVLQLHEEANALLHAAGMVGLKPNHPQEAALLKVLQPARLNDRRKGDLHSPGLRSGNAPALPPLMIGREQALRDIRSHFQAVEQNEESLYRQLLVVVHGWPGVGKTTLASMLVHDPEMMKAFPDGVLWVSLGLEANLLSALGAWGRVLGIDNLAQARSVKDASQQLAFLLRDKRMFLVIDDVWAMEHALPFKVGGRQCGTVITTRRLDIAQALAPSADCVYKLPVLTVQKSVKLLQKLAPDVVAQYPLESETLARELQGLPLALQVAGRLLAAEAGYGWDVADLLSDLHNGVRLLEARVPVESVDSIHEIPPTIAASLKKSIEHLPEMDRIRFTLLGVDAPKPATYDLAALQKLWEIPDPKPTARLLVDRGLLEPVNSTEFQMHALLVMYAKSLLTP